MADHRTPRGHKSTAQEHGKAGSGPGYQGRHRDREGKGGVGFIPLGDRDRITPEKGGNADRVDTGE